MTQERESLVTPIDALRINKDRSRITVQAFGYAMNKPSISFTLETMSLSGRMKTEIVGFTSGEFDILYEFLTEAKKHWEEG